MKQFTNLKFRRRKILLALLLTLLVGANSAWAQKTILSEGFESNDLNTNGWTKNNTHSSTGIYNGDKYSGTYCFRFYYRTNPPQYLISKELNVPANASALNVSLYYKAKDSSYPETFQVGYSTTTNDVSDFTWDTEITASNTTWTEYTNNTFPVGTKYIAIRYNSNNQYFLYIDDINITCDINGPDMGVYDGSTELSSGHNFDFGLTTAGTTKAFTLKNLGTEDAPVSVAHTGNFGAELSATSIPAGSEITLTVTMPDATGDDVITISSTSDAIDDFVINVSGTIRDPNKVYLDFADSQIPDGWTAVGYSGYSSYDWAAGTGYIGYPATSSSYVGTFTSPKLIFTEGEKVFFETAKFSSSTWYNSSITVQYSTDGSSWTTIGSAFTDDVYGTWTKRSVTIPTADAKYIRFSGWNIQIRNIYGGQLPIEPKMVVTQPASLDYGIITEATAKTFTIANTGLATLEGISVTSSDAAFTVTGAPTSLAAGESQEVTITMAATATGALSSDITVSATGMENVVFTVTGVVMPAGMPVEDFAEGLPENWTNSSWTFADGVATGKSSSAYLTTPKLIFSDGDFIVIKAKRSDSDAADYITVQGSSDNGSTWTAYSKKISGSDGLAYPDYGTIVISDIPTTVNKLRFVGFYVVVDEIAGLTYAPVLNVTTGDPAETVATPAAYDFGECAANASVTYNFANTGAGTINITGVAITGDGAAAYSTNWTESVAAPFALTITRTYDAARAGAAQDAAVTVTTSEGAFVINVTGTDKAANAPELAVSTNAIDFGKQTADAVETVTVTNNGTGSMTVNIASDSEDFEVSAATLTEIGAGESKEFTVTFKYGTSYGVKNGNITVTPTYNTEAAQTITATAKAMDPELWSEDFEGGEIPAGWENSGFTVGTSSNGYSLSSTMAVSTYSSSNSTLVTPLLVATAGDKLTFDAFLYWGDDAVKVEYSTDGTDWNTESPLLNFKGSSSTDAKAIRNMEIEAPITGEFYLRFTTCYGNAIDNIEGFKLAPKKEHEATIASSSIPASGNQYVEYTATVTVKEKAGKDDEVVTAELWIGTTKVATESDVTLTANDDKEISLTFTPDAAMSGDAYIKVYNGDLDLTTATQAVTIAAATVLDETDGLPDGLTTGTKPSVVVKYTAKDGWNTIAMPFALTDEILTEIFGEGYQIYEFKRYVESKSIIGFDTPKDFYAGYPYLVYVETAAKHDDGVILKDVNISTTSANNDLHDGVTFQTTYAPIAAPGMEGKYGVTSAGKIQPGSDKASLKGFRAYFSGLPAASSAAQFMLTVDGETVITGIDGITREAQEKLDGSTIYNLKGQKVTVPAKGGLYIINGKKTVLK